jgi:hypothetical protein
MRVLCRPLVRQRAHVTGDGELCVAGGAAVSFESRPTKPEGPLPEIEWRWNHGRMWFRAIAFVVPDGAYLILDVENRHREPREAKLRMRLTSSRPAAGAALDGRSIRTDAGEQLISVNGADIALTTKDPARARIEVRVAVPARSTKTIEFALPVIGRRLSAGRAAEALTDVRRECDSYGETTASFRLNDELLQERYVRAVRFLVQSVAPGADGSGMWLRAGAPPEVGPATADAIILHALDAWGAHEIVDGCLASAFQWQGNAAPPGEAFSSAKGYLCAPPGDGARARWASDCGAVLWAASTRFGREASRDYLKRAGAHLKDACGWILGELSDGGVLPAALGPKLPKSAARAWNDGWSWRGISAAARALESGSRIFAGELAARAREYGEVLWSRWGGDSAARQTLSALLANDELSEIAGRASRQRRTLYDIASLLKSRLLPCEDESSLSAAFLLTLRSVLLSERADGIHLFGGAPADWFASGARLEFDGLPSRHGTMTAKSFGVGQRTLIDIDARRVFVPLFLHVGAISATQFASVRVDGRRLSGKRLRAGTVCLPGGGAFSVEVVWRKRR